MPARKRPRKIVVNADAVWEQVCRMHITLGELARLLGVSPSYLSQLLSGHRSPSVKIMEKLQKILGVKFDDIFLFVENV